MLEANKGLFTGPLMTSATLWTKSGEGDLADALTARRDPTAPARMAWHGIVLQQCTSCAAPSGPLKFRTKFPPLPPPPLPQKVAEKFSSVSIGSYPNTQKDGPKLFTTKLTFDGRDPEAIGAAVAAVREAVPETFDKLPE